MSAPVAAQSDFVWGAKRIAEFLRKECGIERANAKMVYNWYERGRAFPISKAQTNGKLFVSRKAVLATLNREVDAALARCGGMGGDAREGAANTGGQPDEYPTTHAAAPSEQAVAAKGGRAPGRRGPRRNFRGR